MIKEMEINISEIITNLAKIDRNIVKKELEERLELASFLIHKMNEDTVQNLEINLKKANTLSKDSPDFVSYFGTFTHNVLYNLFCFDKETAIKIAEKTINE